MKNKYIAVLFAIITGSFGFHKFYLGKWIQGLLYLLFCFSGIPTIIGILEGVVYLGNTKEDFDIKYNHDYITKQKDLGYKDQPSFKIETFAACLIGGFVGILIYLIISY